MSDGKAECPLSPVPSRVRQLPTRHRQRTPTSDLPFWQNGRSGCVYASGTQRMPSSRLAFSGRMAIRLRLWPPVPESAKPPARFGRLWGRRALWLRRCRDDNAVLGTIRHNPEMTCDATSHCAPGSCVLVLCQAQCPCCRHKTLYTNGLQPLDFEMHLATMGCASESSAPIM